MMRNSFQPPSMRSALQEVRAWLQLQGSIAMFCICDKVSLYTLRSISRRDPCLHSPLLAYSTASPCAVHQYYVACPVSTSDESVRIHSWVDLCLDRRAHVCLRAPRRGIHLTLQTGQERPEHLHMRSNRDTQRCCRLLTFRKTWEYIGRSSCHTYGIQFSQHLHHVTCRNWRRCSEP